MKRAIPIALCFFTIIATAAEDPERVWPGLAKKRCGAEVSLIDAQQNVEVFYPPVEYFAQFKSETIFQGEFDREAVPLRDVIDAFDAGSVRLVDCDSKARIIARDNADDMYIVLAGKGVLKLVSMRAGKPPETHLRFIRLLDFSGPMITRAD